MARVRVQIDFTNSPSLCVQSAADECEIHKILARYRKTGVLPVSAKAPYYADITGAMNYEEALNVVINAQQAFAELSAEERAKYDNDVEKWCVASVEAAGKDKGAGGSAPSKAADSAAVATEPPPAAATAAASNGQTE